jgi:hypothetical protein
MTTTDDIALLIESLVEQIDRTIIGVYNEAEERTETCNTKWAMVGKEVTDESGNKFLITEVEKDQWIKATNKDQLELNGIINLPKPFFINGTKIATNNEWTKKTNRIQEKTPLVWLLEIFDETIYTRENPMDIECEVRLFFLDETNITQNYTKDHRQKVVLPMSELALDFVNVIERNRIFKRPDRYQRKTFSRFGVETESGVIQNILDANLSGVELLIEIKKFKENCKNC